MWYFIKKTNPQKCYTAIYEGVQSQFSGNFTMGFSGGSSLS